MQVSDLPAKVLRKPPHRERIFGFFFGYGGQRTGYGVNGAIPHSDGQNGKDSIGAVSPAVGPRSGG